MSSEIDPYEREVTQHLIDDFGVDSTVTVERVYRESWEKFSDLESDSSYLVGQERTLLWSEFDSKGKFIKKLNWCHRSKDEKAFNTLEKYMREYLYSFDQLDEDYER